MPGEGNAYSFLLTPKFFNEIVLRKQVIWESCFTGSSSAIVLPQDKAFNGSLETKIIIMTIIITGCLLFML